MQHQFTPNKVILEGDVARIEITRRNGDSLLAVIDREDLGKVLSAGRWTASPLNYIVCNNTRQQLHRLVMNAPKGAVVDHVNHDPLDCRKINLRITNHMGNMQNRRGAQANSKSGVRGVHWAKHRNKWRVIVRANGVRHNIGYFDSIDDAEVAAITARSLLHVA